MKKRIELTVNEIKWNIDALNFKIESLKSEVSDPLVELQIENLRSLKIKYEEKLNSMK
jgi:hypothetical protein